MPTAEIVTIGTEILLGEIVDTNAQFIARSLRDLGIDLYRKTTVGDNQKRIAQVLQQAMERCDIILTTGGLGPTVDDPTREAVALAAGVETEFRPELWEQIQERFRRFGRQPTENNKRQAYIPIGAQAIENPVGTAPAFILETNGATIISLPGVPREMEYLLHNAVLPYLREHFDLDELIKSRVLHTAGVGESQIDDLIGDLEALSNPTVALAAHSGQVDVRITAKASSEVEADEKIEEIEAEIRRRLGHWIYGADEDTLVGAALRRLENNGWTMTSIEAGLGGELCRYLATDEGPFRGCQEFTTQLSPEELLELTEAFRQERNATVGLGAAVVSHDGQHEIYLVVITPEGKKQYKRQYGGHPENAARWALNLSLDIIRKL